MTRLKQVLGEHRLAIALALLTSIIVAFPQIYFRIEHRNDGIYQGIELLPDSPWSARAREVQDGHLNFGNVYQKDGKDNPYIYPPLGPIVVGYMGEMFNLDINNTILLSRLVLPFLVFILIYGFVFLFSRDKLVALSSGTVLLLADSILSFSGLSAILHGASPDHFLRLARPVNPAMIYFFLFGFLASFWLFYREKKWVYGIISGIILGLNFYTYFYTWTYLYAFGAILIIFLFVRKEWREMFRIGVVYLISLVLAIPYSLNVYRASLFSTFEELGQRNGVILTHQPLFVGLVIIAALAIFLLLFSKVDRGKYIFGLAILLTPLVTMNQQIITGKIVEPDHYHWFFHKPLAFIFVLITIFYLLGRYKFDYYKKALTVFILISSIVTGTLVQTYAYYYDSNDGGRIAVERQKYGPVMNWLNKNASKEAVVFGNRETSNLTVIYTPLNVFYEKGVCCNSLSATKSRLLDIQFSFYRLRQVNADSVSEVFSQERASLSSNIYGIYYRKLNGSYESIPEDKFEEIVALYKETLSTPTAKWLEQIFTKYEVEYLVWDKKSDPLWQLDKYKFLKRVAEFGDLVVYQR